METRKFFIAPALIILLVIFCFIPFNNTQKIIVKAQLYDVAKQINDLNNWKKWNPDLINSINKISGDYTTDQTITLNTGEHYSLHHINPLAVALIKKMNDITNTSFITVIPSANDSSTYISWSEKVTILKLMERSFTKTNSRQIILNNLKKILEDVNYKYGFFIKIVPVKDTLILTTETEMPGNTSTHIVTDLYNSLHAFIKKNNLPAETKYFYKTQLSNNKVAVGIPVYKQLNNSDNVKFLQLPGNGRLVEGIYQGKLADKQSIYNAINSFMLDQHLKQVAQPLEQYNVADTILNENTNVNIKIYYPVF